MRRFPVKIFLCLILSFSGFATDVQAQNFDIRWLRAINVNRNTGLDPTCKFLTNSATPVSIATPVIVFSIGWVHKDSVLKNKGIYLAETVIVSTFVSTALKYSVARERPFETYPDIEKATGAFSPSFPSGHTSTAFATATSLSIAFPKWYVIAPSFIWAGAIGYSRMHLGVHYPTDVLAGAIIGSGSAYASVWLNRWINKKYR